MQTEMSKAIVAELVDELAALKAEMDELKAELANHQESEFHPDWSVLQATRDSLREHMGRIAEVEAERDALRELVDSAITDFCKLGDVIGPAGYTVSTFYQEALDAIKKGAK